HQHPPVDDQQLACDVAGIVRSKEYGGAGQIVHLAHTPERHVLAAELFDIVTYSRAVNRPRCDCVGTNAVRSQFQWHRAGPGADNRMVGASKGVTWVGSEPSAAPRMADRPAATRARAALAAPSSLWPMTVTGAPSAPSRSAIVRWIPLSEPVITTASPVARD